MDDMSDTFWVQVCLVVMFVAKAVLDEWRQTRLREYNLRIATELHANTVATVQGNEDVSRQIDSATRETTEHAVEARKAASSAAEKAVVIEKKTDKIEERLNGGESGLGARVAKNEARLESLEKGQDAIVKSVESQGHGLSAVARSVDQMTLNFAAFAKRFDKSNPE